MSKETANAKPASSAATGSQRRKAGNDVSAVDNSQSRPRVALAYNMEPTYYIGGGNGNALIEETMNGLGWRRIKDKADENFRLRWCELKSSINYNSLREGEQLVNHIPNCNLLTNKLGLLDSLQEYSRVSASVLRKTVKLDFIPETYRLDDQKDRQTFIDTYKENEIWICKPTARNQGKGIFLVRSLSELNMAVRSTDKEESGDIQREGEGKPYRQSHRIIQRYITNPLLVEGRKFDIRCYMLIASTVPYVVLYHKGYIRLSMYEYDNNCDNIIAHLTNQFIQKKDPKYNELKEETAWSMDRFNEYVNETFQKEKGIERDWVYKTLTTTMKQIMTQAFTAVKNKLNRKVGYFDLYGLDFMVDENMKVWLIEMNINPCLATNCAALRGVVPGVVRETLHLAIECFEKSRRGRPIVPLNSLKEFEILYQDAPLPSSSAKPAAQASGTVAPRTQTAYAAGSKTPQTTEPTKSASPVTRRSRSISPVKEGGPKNAKKSDQVTCSLSVQKEKSQGTDAQRETSSIRATRAIKHATANSTPADDTETAVGVEEKMAAKTTKASTKKKQDSDLGSTQEHAKEENAKTKTKPTSSQANNNASQTPTRPSSTKATPIGGGGGSPADGGGGDMKATKTLQRGTGTTEGSVTQTTTAKKRSSALGRESTTIRDEKPNRGS